MNRIIIPAPFGNWIYCTGATSTIGTFTLQNRGGIIKRLWRCLLTLRYVRKLGGWVNRLGLPNPGIHSIDTSVVDKIVSIYGFDESDWLNLADWFVGMQKIPRAVELNLSCPNVGSPGEIGKKLKEIEPAVNYLNEHEITIIAKLPPIRWMEFVDPMYEVMGVKHFHCCNTIPCPGGGISGPVLKPYSLWAVQQIRETYSDAIIIGGGGVRTFDDIMDYHKAGADHIAIGSAWFNWFRRRKLRRIINQVDVVLNWRKGHDTC